MPKRYAPLALMFAAICAARGAPIEINIPEFPVWCTTASLRLNKESPDNEASKLMNVLEGNLAAEAATNGLTSIGLPFVTELISTETKDGSENTVTLCSAVPAGSPKPNGKVFGASEPRRKGMAALCDTQDVDQCSSALETLLMSAPWSLSKDALEAATRREHPALKDDEGADNLVKSLMHSKDILLGGGMSADTAPALRSSKVVVAILVDSPAS